MQWVTVKLENYAQVHLLVLGFFISVFRSRGLPRRHVSLLVRARDVARKASDGRERQISS